MKEDLEGVRSGAGLSYPKFFKIASFEVSIKELGSADMTNTSHHESLHKVLKPSSRFSNNRLSTSISQMNHHTWRVEACNRILMAGEPATQERISLVSLLEIVE